tara:strand:- start:16961 stop:18811 length:1851 start_codon:yes stop_codon:yes gene_type:complete
MSIKRYTANKDNTISSAFKVNLSSRATDSNMGSSDILEMFAIYGHAGSASLEQSRILVSFPVDQLLSDRTAGILPASGSVTFKLRMFNAEHNQTAPEKITVSAHPLVKSWSEGGGLDMESYLDEGSSNWNSASLGIPWLTAGGDYLASSYMATTPIEMSYNQYLETGLEDLDVDITPLVEEFLTNQAGNSTPASGSIVFNTDNAPTSGDKFKIYAYNGDYNIFQFSNVTGSSGKTHFVMVAGNASQSAKNFIDTINVSSSIKDYVAVTGTDNDLTASFSQRVATFYGNTVISSSAAANVATVTNFAGGTGALNYGVLMKLSGSLEDGTNSRSYYTKKFFARSSHHGLERPIIEAQWDNSLADDRGQVIKSSSLAPAADNLNNIYLYNRQRSGLADIPETGSNLLVKLVPSLGGTPVSMSSGGGVTSNNLTFITASRHSTGIYKAQFAYSGNETTLYDVWQYTGSATEGYVELYTGSSFTVANQDSFSHYEIPSYLTKITNLKSAYASNESATFRVYTRDRNWQPNLYTVATQNAPVDTIKEAFYKLSRVADNTTIIHYSTGSTPSYSSLSYDMSGSFFDLDMSILEPNYLYEISFLYKDGTDYKEQKEKFKFRVDP